jgi:hypothetical protein
MIAKNSDVLWDLWLKWLMVNVIAWLVNLGIAPLFGGSSAIVLGVLVGFATGILQGLPIQKYIRWTWWLVASVLGWAVGTVAASVLFQAVASSMSNLVSFAAFGVIGGTLSAILQYFFQWRRTHHSLIWLLALSIGGALAGLLSGYVTGISFEFSRYISVGKIVTKSTIDASVPIRLGGMLASGVLFGSITALPLMRLLQSFPDKSDGSIS